MTMLLGMAAFATDVGVLFHEKRVAQTVADSAAVAGASDLNAGEPAASLQSAVQSEITQEYGSSWGSAVTLTSPPASGPHAGVSGYVEASVSQTTPTVFMSTFMHLFKSSSRDDTVAVGARAVATDTIKANGCIYVNNPAAFDPAMDLGGNSLVTASHCGVMVNGNLSLGGSSSLVAGYVGVSGTITGTSKITGSYAQATAPQSDPLGYLQQAGNAPTISGSSCTAPTTAPTGTPCFLNANLSGTLASGVYAFNKAPTFGSSVTGSGITIYLKGNLPIDLGNGSLNLTPPTSGVYKGVVLDAPTDTPVSNTCAKGNGKNTNTAGVIDFNFGSSSTTIQGIVYAPSSHLFLQDQGAGTTTIDTDLVVGTICDQSANITIGGYSSGNSPITSVSLVE